MEFPPPAGVDHFRRGSHEEGTPCEAHIPKDGLMQPLTSRKRIALLSLAGAAAGYLFLHPYTMMVYGLYGHSGAPDGHRSFQRLLTTIVLSFHPDMLLMGIPFVLLGAVSGMLLGF
jgi:hypothetical protein